MAARPSVQWWFSHNSIHHDGTLLPPTAIGRIPEHATEADVRSIDLSWQRLADQRNDEAADLVSWQRTLVQDLGYDLAEAAIASTGKGEPGSGFAECRGVPVLLVPRGTPLGTLPHPSDPSDPRRATTPHGVLQHRINTGKRARWGIALNDRELRLLATNDVSRRATCISFDLEHMFSRDDSFSFAALWLLCHRDRLSAAKASPCVLDAWRASWWTRHTQDVALMQRHVVSFAERVGTHIVFHGNDRDAHASHDEREGLRLHEQILSDTFQVIVDACVHDRSRVASTHRIHLLHAGFEARKATLPELDSGTRMLLALMTSHDLAQIYEALLGFAPTIDRSARRVRLTPADSGARQATGTFFTPGLLVDHLIDSAFEPALEELGTDSVRGDGAPLDPSSSSQESAVLQLSVCDPAAGGGAFLGAAAHKLAQRLVALRCKGTEPSPEEYRVALCDVISSCIYGVDIHPATIVLCRYALLAESDATERMASALTYRIKLGDALFGTVPTTPVGRIERLVEGSGAVQDPTTIADLKRSADSWCLRHSQHDDDDIEAPRARREDAARFFHWHLEFPEVFSGRSSSGSDTDVGFDFVVGNPPFLTQRQSATARDRDASRLMRALTSDLVSGYTDSSSAFVHRSIQLCRVGARVAFVMPASFLSTESSRHVRTHVLEHASIEHVWTSDRHVFTDAGVYTCGIVLRRGHRDAMQVARTRDLPPSSLATLTVARHTFMHAPTWGVLAAESLGLPEVHYEADGVLGDHATATADFRDQYYGLDGFLLDDADLDLETDARDHRFPPIVTSGLIDLGVCRWESKPARILKRSWHSPRVDRARMQSEGSLGSWIDRRLVSKIILATQTRAIEVFVDPEGRYLPGLPLVTVVPKQSGDLFKVAAALGSPVASLVGFQRHAGAALSFRALKLSAKHALQLPYPVDTSALSDAASLLREIHNSRDGSQRHALLRAYGAAANEAFNVPRGQSPGLLAWWLQRVDRAERSATARIRVHHGTASP